MQNVLQNRKFAKGGPFAKCTFEALQRGDPLQKSGFQNRKFAKGGPFAKCIFEALQRGDPLQKSEFQNIKFAKGGPFAKIWILAQIEFIRKPPLFVPDRKQGGGFLNNNITDDSLTLASRQ